MPFQLPQLLRHSFAPAIVLLALQYPASAQQEPIAELEALLGGIVSLSADVEQLIIEADGGLLEESAILMRLKKPARFYWETLEPFPELIVTDGETLWRYQPDLEQVVIEDWNKDRAGLAAQLLNGETGGLAGEYRVTVVAAAELRRFELLPVAPDNPNARIAVEFISGQLDLIRLENRNGQQTVWRFADLSSNEPMADDDFVFAPPAGIQIVDSRAEG